MIGRAGQRAGGYHQESFGARRWLPEPLNSSGVQKRSSGTCLRVGCRYWPMVRKSTPAARRSSITCMISSRLSPRPTIRAGFRKTVRHQFLGAIQQAQRGEIARAGAHVQIKPRHGFQIVVENIGARRHHDLDGTGLAQKIRRQHFHRRAGTGFANGAEWSGQNVLLRRRTDRRDPPRSPRHA